MARATFVKSARKDNPSAGIKKGDSYYWWAFMQGGRGGPKRYSKTQPTRSQLTKSEFYGTLWDLEDQLGRLKADSYETVADLEADIESIREEVETLGSEQSDKHSNMPDGLQQGDSGQLLENRASECDSLASELSNLDYSEPEEPDAEAIKEHGDKDAATKAAVRSAAKRSLKRPRALIGALNNMSITTKNQTAFPQTVAVPEPLEIHPSVSALAAELLMKVCDILHAEPARYDQGTERSSCGGPLCIVGHMKALAGSKKIGLTEEQYIAIWSAAGWPSQFREFDKYESWRDIPATNGIARIEHMLTTGL